MERPPRRGTTAPFLTWDLNFSNIIAYLWGVSSSSGLSAMGGQTWEGGSTGLASKAVAGFL